MFAASRIDPTAVSPRALARGRASVAFLRYAVRTTLAAPLLGALWVYRFFFSPALHFVAGPTAGCRFHPTCSVYAAEALRVHGPLVGAWLALRRLAKCTPFHPGGVDFVPPPHPVRPRCVRVPAARL